jgi:hypothetical protein
MSFGVFNPFHKSVYTYFCSTLLEWDYFETTVSRVVTTVAAESYRMRISHGRSAYARLYTV